MKEYNDAHIYYVDNHIGIRGKKLDKYGFRQREKISRIAHQKNHLSLLFHLTSAHNNLIIYLCAGKRSLQLVIRVYSSLGSLYSTMGGLVAPR